MNEELEYYKNKVFALKVANAQLQKEVRRLEDALKGNDEYGETGYSSELDVHATDKE